MPKEPEAGSPLDRWYRRRSEDIHALKESATRRAWEALGRIEALGSSVRERTTDALQTIGAEELRRREFEREHAQIGGLDFVRNLAASHRANVVGADKYFHCKANCEAAKRGPIGRATAVVLSDLRERGDPKNYARGGSDDAAADQQANRHGRTAASSHPAQACSASCASFRPRGLPEHY